MIKALTNEEVIMGFFDDFGKKVNKLGQDVATKNEKC